MVQNLDTAACILRPSSRLRIMVRMCFANLIVALTYSFFSVQGTGTCSFVLHVCRNLSKVDCPMVTWDPLIVEKIGSTRRAQLLVSLVMFFYTV